MLFLMVSTTMLIAYLLGWNHLNKTGMFLFYSDLDEFPIWIIFEYFLELNSKTFSQPSHQDYLSIQGDLYKMILYLAYRVC